MLNPHSRVLFAALLSVIAAPALGQGLSLDQILSRVAASDPGRAALDARLSAARAGIAQAGMRLNPTVGVDVEQFPSTRDFGGLAETTLFYEQYLERRSKRTARQAVAASELALASARARARTLDRLEAAQTAWVEALAADAAVAVADANLAVAERLAREVARRVSAARDPVFAATRARTTVEEARITGAAARTAAVNARDSLARLTGGAVAALDAGPFAKTERTARPDAEPPELTLLTAERDAASARITLEQGRLARDPTLRAGLRHVADIGAVGLVVGGSIPLGRFDRNQGGIAQAQATRTAAEADIAVTRLDLDREVATLTARRAAAAAEANRIATDVLPRARQAVAEVEAGFRRGGGAFTFLEVAEAQRALTAAEGRRVERLRAFHLDGARLDRLTARHLRILDRTLSDPEARP